MNDFDFNKKAKEAQKEFNLGGNFYKPEKGENKIRILACASKPRASHFIKAMKKSVDCTGQDDCKNHEIRTSIKYLTYIFDRLENEIKLWDMPYSVFKEIGNYQKDEDYSFKALPMPYDIKLNFDPEALPNDMYKVIPSPKRTELSQKVSDEFSKKDPINEVRDKLKSRDSGEIKVKDKDIPVVNEEKENPLGEMPPPEEEDLPF